MAISQKIMVVFTAFLVLLCNCKAAELPLDDNEGAAQQPPSCSSSHYDEDEEGLCRQQQQQQQTVTNNDDIDIDMDDDDEDDFESLLEKGAAFHTFLFDNMFAKVDAHAKTLARPDLRAQEQFVLTNWLESVGMDGSLPTRDDDDGGGGDFMDANWLYTLHRRTRAMAPSLFFKVWDERAKPTLEEIRILLSVDDSALRQAEVLDRATGKVSIDENILMSRLFAEFRHRGFTVALVNNFCRILLGPLKTISYAIPTPQNLDAIATYSPLIEVGAGTGYWSAALIRRHRRRQQQNGAEDSLAETIITPYDVAPPKEGERGLYFDRTFTTVHQGECQSLFGTSTGPDNNNNNIDATNRTLLMVWPNNPDNVDNAKEFHSPILPPVWDADCLRAFVKAGGTTIILVAEREVNIHVLPSSPPDNPTYPDSGLCASRELQQLLEREFDLIRQMEIAKWHYSDDLTIWKLKNATTTSTTASTS